MKYFAGMDDDDFVCGRQVLQLVGHQDARLGTQQSTEAHIEKMAPHMSINCTDN